MTWKEIFKNFVNKLLCNIGSTKVWVLALASIFFARGKLDHWDWIIIAGTFLPIKIGEYLINKKNSGGADGKPK